MVIDLVACDIVVCTPTGINIRSILEEWHSSKEDKYLEVRIAIDGLLGRRRYYIAALNRISADSELLPIVRATAA